MTIPLYFKLGSQFMPALYEGSALYMPTALPGISIQQATLLMQEQDRIIHSFPEVESVFGTVGRSDSATDNAPLDMYDTTIMLKPQEKWRPGMTYEKLIAEMDAKLQFPGLTNTWTMPVRNRLDMELTGIKTPLGLKIQGPDLAQIQDIGARMQQILTGIPATSSVFAERVSQGFYLNVEVNRPEAARYGLTVGDVQRVITSAIGGANIAQNIEGRQRFPINVRYERDFRDDPEALGRALVGTPSGAQIPISEVARLSFSRGPAMIRDEDGALTGYVYLDLKTKDYGGFVDQADKLLRSKLDLPAGYTYRWAGEYEFELHAKETTENHPADRVLRHLSVALHGLQVRSRGRGADLSDPLCHVWWTHPAMGAGLQLQRRGVGGIHRAVWYCSRNRGRDGGLLARSAATPARHGNAYDRW